MDRAQAALLASLDLDGATPAGFGHVDPSDPGQRTGRRKMSAAYWAAGLERGRRAAGELTCPVTVVGGRWPVVGGRVADPAAPLFAPARARELIALAAAGAAGSREPTRRPDELRNALPEVALTPAAASDGGWHLGDWQNCIDALPEGAARIVRNDPPYSIGYDARSGRHEPLAGERSPKAAGREVTEFVERVRPKLTADARALVFCDHRGLAFTKAALATAGLEVRGLLVQVKPRPGIGDLTHFARWHELVVYAARGSPQLYDFESDVLEFAPLPPGPHPTEKAWPLLERLLELLTVEGDLVLDPFAVGALSRPRPRRGAAGTGGAR